MTPHGRRARNVSASGPYSAAVSAERDAQRLFDAGRLGDATIKFYDASRLFRSAEVAAQNETTRRETAARADSLGPERSGNAALPPPATSQQAENREPRTRGASDPAVGRVAAGPNRDTRAAAQANHHGCANDDRRANSGRTATAKP